MKEEQRQRMKQKFEYAGERSGLKHKANNFSFDEKEPEIGSYITLIWEDGSMCECTYDGLDKSIIPLPTHWYYVQ